MYVSPIVFIISLLIVIAIIFVIFLLIRNFICWYYKININIKLLESINNKLEFLSKQNFPDEYIEFEKSLKPLEPIEQNINIEKDIKEKHICSKCETSIQGKEYYCAKCDEYFCYDCILSGAKCPKCKSRLIN